MVPLQFGIPGGPELLITLLIFFVVFGLIGRWVYNDAKSRGSEWAWQWGVGIAFLFLVGLIPGMFGIIIYFLIRGDRSNQ